MRSSLKRDRAATRLSASRESKPEEFRVMPVGHACPLLFNSGEFSGPSDITNSGII